MPKKSLLKDIAAISSGYLFKSRVENNKDGNIKVIQLKDVDNQGKLNLDNLFKVKIDDINESALLQKFDILFKSKSNYHTASNIGVLANDKMIVTSHFFIVRVTNKGLMPEYLTWFLNQKNSQQYFQTQAGGTTVHLVNKKVLGELPVVFPNLDIQRKIIAVIKLFSKEKELVQTILTKKEKLINAVFLQQLKP